MTCGVLPGSGLIASSDRAAEALRERAVAAQSVGVLEVTRSGAQPVPDPAGGGEWRLELDPNLNTAISSDGSIMSVGVERRADGSRPFLVLRDAETGGVNWRASFDVYGPISVISPRFGFGDGTIVVVDETALTLDGLDGSVVRQLRLPPTEFEGLRRPRIDVPAGPTARGGPAG